MSVESPARMEYGDRRPAKRHWRVIGGHKAMGYFSIEQRRAELIMSRQVSIQSAFPDSSYLQFFQDRDKTVHVVRMGMRQYTEVQPADTLVPEPGDDDATPDIKAVVTGASAIDQDGLSPG